MASKNNLWHRIKYRNSVTPLLTPEKLPNYVQKLKRRRRITLYRNKIIKMGRSEGRVSPASVDFDFSRFCRNCPTTAMSRFQERDILRKVAARGLEIRYSVQLNAIMSEAKDEFVKATRQSGIERKLKKVEKEFHIRPYKYLGKTDNYSIFLQRQKELGNRFILHRSLVRKILNECVTNLPYQLFDLHISVRQELGVEELKKVFSEHVKEGAQKLQEFYQKILVLVEQEKSNTDGCLEACAGLLSVNISRTLAHTILHVVSFTASKDHPSYLKLSTTYDNALVLQPNSDQVTEIYADFLRDIIENCSRLNVFEKYKTRQIRLCLAEEFFKTALDQIRDNISKSYIPILEYVKKLNAEFSDVYTDLCSMEGVGCNGDLVFKNGCRKLLHFRSYLSKVAFIPDNAYFTIGRMAITDYREILKRSLLDIIGNIFSSLSAQHEWENSDICEAFDIIYMRATKKPITTEEMIEIGKYMAWVRSEFLEDLKERVVQTLSCLCELIQLGTLSEEHIKTNAKAINWLDKILPILEENNTNYEQLKFEAEEKLQKVIEEINVDINDVYPSLDVLDSMDAIGNIRAYLNTITLQMVNIKKIETKIEWINKEEISLNFPKSTYMEFDELKNHVYPFYHLLKLCLDVQRNLSVWLDGQFDLINYEKVKTTVEKYHKELAATQKLYRSKLRQAQDENLFLRFKGTVDDPDMLNWPAPLKLCSKAVKLIQDFEPSLTVIKIMCNEALMKRHWMKMSKVAGFDITPNAGTTLKKIVQIDLAPNLDKYESISLAATKEKELLEGLQRMLEEWKSIYFKSEIFESVPIITGLDDVEIVLEDHMIKVTNMLNSIHVRPYVNRVMQFYEELQKISKTIEECGRVQREWLHLNPLFSCERIALRMNTEAEIFKQISNTYTDYIQTIHKHSNVYTTVNDTNILQDLLICDEQLELIHQGVDRYFQEIRTYFPRFYLVSNDEMYHILSVTIIPTKISRFIKSLFYEVNTLKFDGNSNILGIIGDNGETLHLDQTVGTENSQGCAEIWLKELETRICQTIKTMIRNSYLEIENENWLFEWPSQILNVTDKICFTENTTNAIQRNHLTNYLTLLQEKSRKLIALIKSQTINNSVSLKIQSLLLNQHTNITTAHHLKESNITDVLDFEWMSQLRYYLNDICNIKLFDTEFVYGYEYLGDCFRNVIMPATMKCYHSLVLIYKYHLCGHLKGGAGNGKTEAMRSLAKALGIPCKIFRCCQGFSFEAVLGFLKGVTSTGFWLFIEDLDNIDIEIASILAQQLANIATALKIGACSVRLNADEIPLRKCFICCTMKDYGKFPENFKILFRPLVVSRPDCQILAQIILFSMGYDDWFDMGKKLRRMFQIMSSLLPNWNIYGGQLIQDIFNFQHNTITMEIICENIYKRIASGLTKNEIIIFEKIMKEVFPTFSKKSETDQSFCDEIVKICKEMLLDPKLEFIDKLQRIHEAMIIKQPVIIVGDAFTGKTTMLYILREFYKNVHLNFFNPITLTSSDIYGKMDDEKNTFLDGLITKPLRQNAKGIWIVCDTPTNFQLTEEVNALLEEKKQLHLLSGEVLNVASNFWFVFETRNLERISPATVSRCNIIYLSSDVLNWRSIFTSWLEYRNCEWKQDFKENIAVLFDWVVPPCLDFVMNNCHQLCKVNVINLVKTSIQVFEMLLNEAYSAILRKEDDPKNLSSWIQASFIQAMIWGIGSTLDKDSSIKLDEFFKQLWKGQNKLHPYPNNLEKIEVNPPTEDTIFDHNYLYKSKGNWKYWSDVLKNEKITECQYLTNLFVPTPETVKYTAFIKMHLSHKIPLMLIGPTGTGKTTVLMDVIMNKTDKKNFQLEYFAFTASETMSNTRKKILAKFPKNRKGHHGPVEGKHAVLFIDDFNESSKNENGVSGSVELIREFLDQKRWYNLKTHAPLYLNDINILAAMTSTYRNDELCSRVLRHFNVFSINKLCEESITRIFSSALLTKWRKIGFPSDIVGTVNQIIAATNHFFKSVGTLTAPFNWNFYFFNMANFARVINTFAMIRKETADANKKFIAKLWTHEIFQILGCRIIETEWLTGNIKLALQEFFKEDYMELFESVLTEEFNDPNLENLFFGTYTDVGCLHFEEANINKLAEIVSLCAQEMKINLVCFEEMLRNFSRISRVISIPNCNLMQIGMCGTGRQTLVKLACYIYKQQCFRLKLTEDFNIESWHIALKAILKECCGFGKPCTFFLKEEEIVFDEIIDDLIYLLKNGEIPFIYSLAENREILDILRDSMPATNGNIDESWESMWLHYRKRAKDNLHIIISFNKTNQKFKAVHRKHPRVRTYFEINNVGEWSQSSLECIAKTWIADLNIENETKLKVVKSFGHFHYYLKDHSKSIPVTDGSYLEFLRLYINLIYQKQQEIVKIRKRYLAALEKLSFASVQISEMQKSLAEYQPQLEEMTKQATDMAKEIASETNEVERASNLVKKDEKIANEQAAAAQILKLDCEADLAQAIPILEDAISALNTLKPTDITLVKSMKNPPDAIKLVMAAVCVIKDVKPDRIPDPSTGRKTIDYWGPSKRILGDMNFLQTLKDFDKDNIKPDIILKIRKDYLPHKDFKPHVVAKASSAAEGLCKWIIAMDMYDKVAKEVAPKKEKLEKAEKEYAETVAILNEKKVEVARIEQRLAELNQLLREATRKQKKLQRDVDMCKRKLSRAQKLIGGLSEEKVRWSTAVEHLQNEYDSLPGDMLVTCATIAYLGPFTDRNEILDNWIVFIKNSLIPFDCENYNLFKIFKKTVNLDIWLMNGLLDNEFFIENGIIDAFSKRWSFFIDPQHQASNYIKQKEKLNGIRITKFTCPKYMSILRECIVSGLPLLVENVEVVSPSLSHLLTQNTFFKGEIEYLCVGGEILTYNRNFVLYLATGLKYPKFNSEIYDRLTVIDFRMNKNAMEEHLLTCVVENEKPALKKVKLDLFVERKRNKEALANIEENILTTLSESKTDILEDEVALQILDDAKVLLRDIQKQYENSITIKESLNEFRKKYEIVAQHSSCLYFTTYQLTKLNHMYQFSYTWFLETFIESIRKAHKFRDLSRRLKSFTDTLTRDIYSKITRSIFGKDKLLFSFLLCSNLLILNGEIERDEMDYFVTSNELPNSVTGPNWLPQNIWNRLRGLKEVDHFKNIESYFFENESQFLIIFESRNPENELYPDMFNTNFRKLLLISLLRSKRLYYSTNKFVEVELGLEFLKCPHFDIADSFADSHILSPLIFILTPGVDVIDCLQTFAILKQFNSKLITIPLKNGERTKFEEVFERSRKLGLWICIQNCHLLGSFLNFLNLKLEEIDYSNTHENFRLWLTTHEDLTFPISLLERSVKIIKEEPRGVKNKMMNMFSQNPVSCPRFYTNCPGKHEIFVRFLYSIAYLHCVLEERKRFGCFGWTTPYEFNQKDFLITIYESQDVINNFNGSLKFIRNLVGNCTYGAYIVDALDRKIFDALYEDYFGHSCEYFTIPLKVDHQDCINHILKLPESDSGAIFGLHENYDITRDSIDSLNLRERITITFEEILHTEQTSHLPEIIEGLLLRLSESSELGEKHETGGDIVINLIVSLEFRKWNESVAEIKRILRELQQVIGGGLPMTNELENMCYALINNKVPERWEPADSLSAFVDELVKRGQYFKDFVFTRERGVWLGAFAQPKAFLTAVQLFESRRTKVGVDDLYIYLRKMDDDLTVESFPIEGLFLTGANWNETLETLEEPLPKVIKQAMPPVRFFFTNLKNKSFQCPLYKRIPNLRESNFITDILLKSTSPASLWIKQKTLLACNK